MVAHCCIKVVQKGPTEFSALLSFSNKQPPVWSEIHVDTSYPHDGHADKDSYPHDGRANKDSYPYDRHIQYIMLSL